MVFSCCVNLCANKCQRIFAACSDIICTAADLEDTILTCINCAEVEVCAFDRFASLNFADNDFRDVFAYFILFLYFETAAEELFFEHVRSNVNIYIIFKPT